MARVRDLGADQKKRALWDENGPEPAKYFVVLAIFAIDCFLRAFCPFTQNPCDLRDICGLPRGPFALYFFLFVKFVIFAKKSHPTHRLTRPSNLVFAAIFVRPECRSTLFLSKGS